MNLKVRTFFLLYKRHNNKCAVNFFEFIPSGLSYICRELPKTMCKACFPLCTKTHVHRAFLRFTNWRSCNEFLCLLLYDAGVSRLVEACRATATVQLAISVPEVSVLRQFGVYSLPEVSVLWNFAFTLCQKCLSCGILAFALCQKCLSCGTLRLLCARSFCPVELRCLLFARSVSPVGLWRLLFARSVCPVEF